MKFLDWIFGNSYIEWDEYKDRLKRIEEKVWKQEGKKFIKLNQRKKRFTRSS